MMKRLLASTMLASAVVLSGGFAAQAADVTISGNSEFTYQTWSDEGENTGGNNDSKMSNESHIVITAEAVSDSGLTYGTYYRIEAGTGNGGSSNLKEDGHRLYVSGDFGKVVLGGSSAGDTYYSDVLDRMVDKVYEGLTSGSGLPGFGYQTALSGDEVISYHSPNLSGFSGGVSISDEGGASKADAREIGLKYTAAVMMDGSVTLRYASGQRTGSGIANTPMVVGGPAANYAAEVVDSKKDEVSSTSFGFDFSTGAFGFGVSRNTRVDEDPLGTKTKELSNTGFAATYQASDTLKLALGKVTAEDAVLKDNSADLDLTAFTAAYTIATGLTTGLEYTTWSGQTDTTDSQKGTYTVLYMNVGF